VERMQIYLTEEERGALVVMAERTGRTQSELMREAVDGFTARYRKENRLELLRGARVIWKDRDDLPDLEALRKRSESFRQRTRGVTSMQMISVSSSAISAVGYDPRTMRMQIRFKQGHTYTFCRVPQHVFDSLLGAGSKGTYYDQHIRDRYQC
jgi:hypothetical protein